MTEPTFEDTPMATRTRLNLYFDPALIPQIEAMALRRSVSLRRNVSKSAIVAYSGRS